MHDSREDRAPADGVNASDMIASFDKRRSASTPRKHDVMRITSVQSELDLEVIHRFLCEESTWARGIPRPLLERAIEHSLCFGGFIGKHQVAFARVVTDRATFANLVDVFVLTDYRGRGFAKEILRAVMAHSDLQGLRRFTLATGDAHNLYRRFGFGPPSQPQSLMERYVPEIYLHASSVPVSSSNAATGA